MYVLVAQLCPTVCSPIACSPQAPLSVEFSRQEYWSGLPFSFSRGSSWLRDQTQISRTAGRCFTVWDTWKAWDSGIQYINSNFLLDYTAFEIIIKYKAIFPCGSDGKESACSAEEPGLIPGLGKMPREGNGNSLQYSRLENSMDRRAWLVIVHGVAKSQIWLSN